MRESQIDLSNSLSEHEAPIMPKRRRRLGQFSLRLFLLGVVCISAFLGWFVYRAERPKKAAAKIRNIGGLVRYDFDLDKSGLPLKDALPPGPEWFRNAIGIDFLCTIRSVTFAEPISTLNDVTALPGLKYLTVNRIENADLQALANCHELMRLQISTKTFVNLDALAELPALKQVYFFSDNLNDVSPFAKFPSLERLAFESKNVSDLSPLSKMTTLKSLNLLYMNGRDSEFDKLTKQLPNCQVIRQDRKPPPRNQPSNPNQK